MESTEKWRPGERRRIYLLRHAEVEYFDRQGRPFRPDTVPLNRTGERQAEAAALAVAFVPFDRVMTSDLLRSVETARIVIAGKNLESETRVELREIQPGRLADLPAESIEAIFLDAFKHGLRRETQFLGGETFGSLQDRVLKCFEQLLAETNWRHLLLVAHGGVNRVLLAHALGCGLQSLGSLEQDYGCINIIDVAASGQLVVRLMNHTPYNPAKLGLELTTMETLYQQYRAGAGN